jgi:hypothetical protein
MTDNSVLTDATLPCPLIPAVYVPITCLLTLLCGMLATAPFTSVAICAPSGIYEAICICLVVQGTSYTLSMVNRYNTDELSSDETPSEFKINNRCVVVGFVGFNITGFHATRRIYSLAYKIRQIEQPYLIG